MKNINKVLLDAIGDDLHQYDCFQNEIEVFLNNSNDFIKRQNQAKNIIKDIMRAHGKKELLSHLSILARIEYKIRELEPCVRDHVVHALLSFILGIYINKYYFKIRGISIDPFQWKLASLFHDIGYPVQIASSISDQYFENVNKIVAKYDAPTSKLYMRSTLVGFEDLKNGENSFELLQKRIDEWSLQINIKEEYKNTTRSGNICHGILSSLTLLSIIDSMYQYYNPKREYKDIIISNANWNQCYFDKDVISACSAIYIHNLSDRCFIETKIDYRTAPLAFLLKLSDNLQGWERPFLKESLGESANKYGIKILNNKLIFTCKTSQKEDIKKNITSSLVADNITIC